MPQHAKTDLSAALLQKVRLGLYSSEISDKGLTEFWKTVSKLPGLRTFKLNLMNNEVTEKAMKMGSPHL